MRRNKSYSENNCTKKNGIFQKRESLPGVFPYASYMWQLDHTSSGEEK